MSHGLQIEDWATLTPTRVFPTLPAPFLAGEGYVFKYTFAF